MRTTFTSFLLSILLSVTLYAVDMKAQSVLDSQVTVSFSGATLKEVIANIQSQVHVKFMYSPNAIDLEQPVTFQGHHVKLRDFFNNVLTPLEIGFKEVDGRILLFAPKKEALPDPGRLQSVTGDRVITGTVTDAEGNPLPGASVSIKGTNAGTRSDAKGKFNITVTGSGPVVLEVSYIGYAAKTVTVTGNTVSVTLENTAITTKEVVVTALGISKSGDKLGYATTTVNGHLLNQAKEPNVANSLVGRVAGLSINSVNSGPGSSSRILIRGITNFTSNTGPLIVIDGVPMDNTQKGSAGVYGGADMGDGISSVNPDDIENIVVLKGSTASALYGSRASNGVIQITTKSGKGAKGFGVEFTSNFTANSIVNNTDYQKVYGHGINGYRPATITDLTTAGLNSWGEKMDGAPAIAQDGKMYPYSPVNRQWNKFYRVAPVVINTVSLVNGGENGNMRLSLSHTNNQSVIPESWLKRYSVNLNINQYITKGLKVAVMANYLREKVNHRPYLNDMSRNPNFTMAILPANISPAYLKPGYDAVTGYEWAMNSEGYQTNPWFAVNKFETNTDRNRLTSATSLRYDILKELYVQARVGLDLVNDDLWDAEPTGTGYKRTGGLSEQSKAQTMELNADVLAGYSRALTAGLTMDLALGGNMRKFEYQKDGTSGNQWKMPFLYTPTNLVTTSPVYSYIKKQTNSGYYTFDFTFQRFLTLGTTGRYDVFSTLPAGKRGIFTPSVYTSVVFSDKVHTPGLSYGKLRLSYAQTSGEADPYQTSIYYQIQPSTAGGKPFGNTLPQTSNIASLKPYRMKEFEAGLELKWLKNRLGADITYFNRRTKDELIAKTISIASGYTSVYEPLGATQNKGMEIVITGTPIRRQAFTWNSSFNFTLVDNRIVSTGNSGAATAIAKSGEGQYRPSVGPYSNGASVGNLQGLPAAQILVYDYLFNADGRIVIGTDGIPMRGALQPVGSGLPKYYGGINNEFSYNRFSFSFLVDYRFGCKVLSGTDFFSIYYGLNKSTLPGRETGIIADGVTRDGKENNTLVSAQNYYQGLVKNISSISVFDGSFIKLRQVTLGYSLPDNWFRQTPFQGISLSLTARNLLTLMKHTENFDPEDTFSSLPGNAGLQGGGLPQTRTYGVNLNVKFKK